MADIEKYKAYCNFPIHEKQNIVRYHKNNGNITVTLTSGVLDTLTQMESDISIVGAEEKLNAVRLNADLLVKEKRYELIPLCINWARIFYRNIVHIMQYILLLQVSLGVCAFIGVTANHAFPFDPLPMLFMGIGTCIPAAINIYHRVPGSRLEDNQGVLKDDRVASLQVLIIIPLIAGAIQALSVMLSRQIAYFATQDPASAAACATFTFIFASYFSSLSLKFDSSLFKRLKEIGRSGLVTGLICAAVSILLCLSPLQKLWLGGKVPVSPGVWTVVLALLLSVLPLAVLEGLKLLNKEDPAKERDS